MKRLFRFVRLAPLFALALSIGCQESVTYTYFKVSVSFDRQQTPDALLALVRGCAVNVDGAHTDSEDLDGCSMGVTRFDLGQFDYSTSATSGNVTFEVVARDLNREVLARGTAGPLPINEGQTSTTNVVLVPTPEGLKKLQPQP